VLASCLVTSSAVYPDFERREMTFLGETRPVFVKGERGPAVIVMHEAPGLYPGVADFGRRVVAAGFRVFMPSLVGTPGRPMGLGYSLSTLARACVMREFTIMATRQNSPVTEWLRELARAAHEECGGPGVGAVGMCLTGGFALAMMVDDRMLAPVLSQPSLPFPVGAARRAGLHLGDQQLVTLRRRAREEGLTVLGLRFTGDPVCPKERFDHLRQELGAGFEAIEIDSSRGNPHGIPTSAHSVVTTDLVDREGHPTKVALDRVLSFFRERLI
jgi:dienelactone hydrolase